MGVYRSACVVALGPPTRRAFGGLPGARALGADINEPGWLRHTATMSGTGATSGPSLLDASKVCGTVIDRCELVQAQFWCASRDDEG